MRLRSKERAVLRWLWDQSIDKLEAQSIGVMRLSAVIYRLRKMGYKIKTACKVTVDRPGGNVVEIPEYYLKG